MPCFVGLEGIFPQRDSPPQLGPGIRMVLPLFQIHTLYTLEGL
jgi:hypothetical protein